MQQALITRITIDPEICHSKPTIRGLRYPVDSILEYLAAGNSIEDILNEFPDLEREDILACFAYPKCMQHIAAQPINGASQR